MAVLKCIHHINFIVADLDAAVDAYQEVLGIGTFEYEALPERGVLTARTLVGDVWLVLVSPQGDDSIASRYLRTHGEGFFLLSFGVEDLGQALADLAPGGTATAVSQSRDGIHGWRVADLETEKSLGVRFHLTEVRQE